MARAIPVQADVTNHSDVKKAFDCADKELGGVDFVVANSGESGTTSKLFHEAPFEEFEYIINLNLKGSASTLYHAVPHFKKRGGGCIIFISSVASAIPSIMSSFSPPSVGLFSYGPSKAAVNALVHSCSSLGKDNIRAYGLLSAVVDTETSRRAASGMGIDIEAYVMFNPIFKTLGKCEYIATTIEGLFTNTNLFPPFSLIGIDNDAYFSAHEFYKTLETNQPWNIDLSKVYNIHTNEPYDFSNCQTTKQ